MYTSHLRAWMRLASVTMSPLPMLMNTDLCSKHSALSHALSPSHTHLGSAVLQHVSIQKASGLRGTWEDIAHIVTGSQEPRQLIQLAAVVNVGLSTAGRGACQSPHLHPSSLAQLSHCRESSSQ